MKSSLPYRDFPAFHLHPMGAPAPRVGMLGMSEGFDFLTLARTLQVEGGCTVIGCIRFIVGFSEGDHNGLVAEPSEEIKAPRYFTGHAWMQSNDPAKAAMESPTGLDPSNGDRIEKLIRLYCLADTAERCETSGDNAFYLHRFTDIREAGCISLGCRYSHPLALHRGALFSSCVPAFQGFKTFFVIDAINYEITDRESEMSETWKEYIELTLEKINTRNKGKKQNYKNHLTANKRE